MKLTRRQRVFACSIIVLAAVAAGCGGDRATSPAPLGTTSARASGSGGSAQTSDDPTFLQASPSAPPIANPVISFWAVKGIDRSVKMVYQSRPGHNDSTTFLFFRVRQQSLVNRADGTRLANGDSVLITVTLVDPVQLKVDFQPSGLRFSNSHPAVLKLSYAETIAPGALNTLQIWCRENPLAPWLPLSSVVFSETDEVQADISGFTGYALAY